MNESILDLKKECITKGNIEFMMEVRQHVISAEVFKMDTASCQSLIESIRALPLIPKINAMSIPQVAEYLMLSIDNVRYVLDKNKDHYLAGLFTNYGVSYVAQFAVEKVRVPHTPWQTLTFENGVTTTLSGHHVNFFSPKAVLLTALLWHGESPMCKHIQQKVFLILTGFDEFMEPPTPLPEPISVERRFKPVGGRMSARINVEGLSPDDRMVLSMSTGRPVIDKITAQREEVPLTPAKVEKVSEPMIRPMFVAGHGYIRPNQKLSREIDAVIMARYKGFGGNDSARVLSQVTGISQTAVCNRVHAIKRRLSNAASVGIPSAGTVRLPAGVNIN